MGGGGSGRKHRDPIEVSLDSGRHPLQVDQQGLTAETADYKPGSGMGAVVVHHLVTAMLVVLAVALGTWGYLSFSKVRDGFLSEKRTRPFEHQALAAQSERLHFALAVFFALYGNYPPSLEGLVDEGLLQPSDLEYPPGPSSIVYERVGDSYRLIVEKTVVTQAPADAATPAEGEAQADANEAPAPTPSTEQD